ncbi:hypothetical protein WJX73_002953 [Symbiochloris irregularis]|uniref:PPM-type phosphatase domain-containing protein n=1 Tax=Symbiochloris irregularis TaxID=706552 RepID=A0AAW1NNE4_9CHLO
MAEPVVSPFAASSLMPLVKYAYLQSELKGEDLLLVAPRVEWPVDGADTMSTQEILLANERLNVAPQPTVAGGRTRLSGTYLATESDFGLFCVFDGHNGRDAAAHCRNELLSILMALLPSGPLPADQESQEFRTFCGLVQKALVVSFMQLQHGFAVKGKVAGSTATVVLQCGWLLTVANVGDSYALLDTGSQTMLLTADHRVASSKTEQERMTALGIRMTNIDSSGHGPAADPAKGIGPLRIWPGGVMNARVIGDLTSGNILLASPSISQVRVPSTGGRVIVASDGLWDCFEPPRVVKLTRRCTTAQAADTLINSIIRAQGGLKDDTSLIVFDMLPADREFPHAELIVMAQLDTAALLGFVPRGIKERNDSAHMTWQDPKLLAALKDTQEESALVWQQASKNASMGLQPVRSFGGSASLVDYFREERTEARTKRKEGLARPSTFPLSSGRPPLPHQGRPSLTDAHQDPLASTSTMGNRHQESLATQGIGRSSSSPATSAHKLFSITQSHTLT